jgi:drug/metabolite transporter (DMT)-like permease
MLVALVSVIGLLAAGQILFKHAAIGIRWEQPATLLSWPLFIALLVYALATVGWVFILSRLPLSVAFPFYGLTFLIVPVLAWFFLQEPMRMQTMLGGVLIMIGVVVSTAGAIDP